MKKLVLFAAAMMCGTMMAFASIVAQLPIDGIVYSLTDDMKAMVMPASAFEKSSGAETDATGNERYTGKVVIPSSVKYMGTDYEVDMVYTGAFSDCPDLTEVVFPATIKKLLAWVFGVEAGKTSKLTAITCLATDVPDTDAEAFGNLDLSKITVTVPAESLQKYAEHIVWWQFWPVYQLPINGIVYSLTTWNMKAMVMPAFSFEKSSGADADATGDERYTGKITIPSKVTYKGKEFEVDVVYSGTFSDCPDLTEVVFPATIKKLLAWVFGVEAGKTSKLTAITCQATTVPETDAEAFGNLDLSKITVTVPAEALADYKAEAEWGKFWKATGLDNVQSDKVQGTKILRDGQLYLMYEGRMYDVRGAEVK